MRVSHSRMKNNPSELDPWPTFRKAPSERAFEAVVRRYADLVFSVARRRAFGNLTVAEEITQSVFSDLAQKGPRLSPKVLISSWLYQHTCYTAAKYWRGEQRRLRRETRAAEAMASDTETAWQDLEPLLDQALLQLSERDREAVIMRFYENCRFKEMGQQLGTSEDAARKRVERALTKLRSWLERRGLRVSAVALAALLEESFVCPAPASIMEPCAMPQGDASWTSLGTGLPMKCWTAGMITIAFASGFAVIPGWHKLTEQPGGFQRAGVGESIARRELPPIPQASRPQIPTPTVEEVLASEDFEQLDLLVAFLPTATEKELATIVAHWGKYEWQPLPDAKWKLILARWLEIDPIRAAQAAEDYDQPYTTHRLEDYVYLAWAQRDYKSALQTAMEDPEAAQAMSDEISKRDLPVALELLERYPGMRRMGENVLAKLAESMPDSALEKAQTLPDSARDRAIRAVIQKVSESDPVAALKLADSIPSLIDRNNAKVAVIHQEGPRDPRFAFDQALQLPPGKQRRDTLFFWAKLQSKTDPMATIALAETLQDPQERRTGMSFALRALAESGKENLLTLLDLYGWDLTQANARDQIGMSGIVGGDLGNDAQNAIVKLAATDPSTARAYLNNLPEGEWKEQALYQWKKRYPETPVEP